MSKTIEIWHGRGGQYEVVSPDANGVLHVDGYTLKTDREALMEDGVQTVNISPDEYFHIEKDGNHAIITVEDEPPEPETVEITHEPVGGNGPLVFMELTRENLDDSEFEYTGVKIEGTEYDLVER